MAIQHKVEVGQTLSGIAKEYGVTVNDITGFRSNDPNTIFPGEMLTITEPPVPGQPQEPLQPAPAPTIVGTSTGLPAVTPLASSATPQPNQSTPTGPRTAPAPTLPGQLPAQTGQAQAPVAPAVVPGTTSTPQKPAPLPQPQQQTFTTPSGAEVDEAGALIKPAPGEDPLAAYGVSPDQLEKGFTIDPIPTLDELITTVMGKLNFGQTSEIITNISKEIEDLENERDDQIEQVNDNPFVSAGTKNARIDKINDRYELRIRNRTNRLALEQHGYENARQQAQFAITTAIGLYDKNRNFQADQIQAAIDAHEKKIAAETKLDNEPSSDDDSSDGLSIEAQRIIDGLGSLKTLTPSKRTQVENELYTLGYGNSVPPEWFREHAERKARQSLLPEKLQTMWDAENARVLGGGSTSTGGSTDGLPAFEDYTT